MIDVKMDSSPWRSLAVPLSVCLLLAACNVSDEALDSDDDSDNGNADVGGDTSGYSGLMAWRFGDVGEGSGIRLWQLEDSDFTLTIDEGEQGGEHLGPRISADQRVLVYTVDPVSFEGGALSQVQWFDMGAGEFESLPRELSGQGVRASFAADLDQFGSVLSFAERVHESPADEPSHYGAGVWVVGNEQAQSLVQSDQPIHCTRMDADGSFVLFDQPDAFHVVNSSGGNPQPLNLSHPNLSDIVLEPREHGDCPYQLSENGNRLAFMGTLDEDEEALGAFFADINSGQVSRVDHSVEMTLVDWQMAANGNEGVLLYRTALDDGDMDDGDYEYALHTVNLVNPGATTEIDTFTLNEDDPVAAGVSISPSGQIVARSGYDEDGIHIKVMTFSGSDKRRIQGDDASMGDGVLGLTF